VPVDMLQSLQLHNLSPAQLKIKLGCWLIVTQNLSINHGLCNGTWLMLTGSWRQVLQVRLLNGWHKMIPRIKLMVVECGLLRVLYRRQFPVTPAIAMTTNKAQE
jgi:hypothetical protein